MKIIAFLAVFLICAGFASAESGFVVNDVQENYGILGMSLEHSDDDISNARVKAVILDSGIYFPAKTADLREDEPYNLLMMPEDSVPEGEHIVRISITKGSMRKVVYRYVFFE
ncbi:hypothetical protein JW707_04630 [Candidatus Woesearchaeota archaeon]|nr:hypothetical protein [Candidatus Woesearchaeota archaeon]